MPSLGFVMALSKFICSVIHYLYLEFCITLKTTKNGASDGTRAGKRRRRGARVSKTTFTSLVVFSLGAILSLMAAKVWSRNYEWNDEEILMRSAYEAVPDSLRVH